ncbi:MAG: SPFH domain-containing protein [Phycisphaerales bacterium JB043]
MSAIILMLGVFIAIGILVSIPKTPKPLRLPSVLGAVVVLLIAFTLSSFRLVGDDSIGVVIKNVGTTSLPEGQIIATGGEKGPQARILPPGWHPWLWPFIYEIEQSPVVTIGQDEVGLITALDGKPLPAGEVFAPEWSESEFQNMLNAEYFLSDGNGYKGPQTSVLTPGKYRINPKLYAIERVNVTNIQKATVGVVKSNVGPASADVQTAGHLVARGQRGIWNVPFEPQKLYLNTKAYEVTVISTDMRTIRYTAGARATGDGEQREITVRSSDGFTFPVDVRIEYLIRPEDAPVVVANFRDDGTRLQERLNSVVRSVFRNNAESEKALDYVQQRSSQEASSLSAISSQMQPFGVTVTGVRIGDVGNEQTLGELLKTQTDREIALQQQITFQEQQRAAEQRKALTRTEQEAEEEKRLATAQYEVQIAEQAKQQQIIAAQAQAEQISIEAQAQAEAFRVIAQQIGRGNAAMIELLKIVGERGIQITPRVMVVGENGSSSDAETTALIGTMLDQMVRQQESADSNN